MIPSILAIGTAVPPFNFRQDELVAHMIDLLDLKEQKKEQIERLYQNSAIKTRYSVLPDFQYSRSQWDFWGKNYPQQIPNMAKRNDIYKEQAPKLALQAAQQTLNNWGQETSKITHVISVSCTGMIAPGIEFELVQQLNLNRSVNRLGINFMGCFGAFKGLAVAQSFAKENPNHRILIVCTELCSLHLQADLDLETLTANSLFADGAAAVIVGSQPKTGEESLFEIINQTSLGLDQTLDKMSWEASERGFLMRLSPYVPALIGRHIKPFTETLLGKIESKDCDWAIHPGGKSILQAVEKAVSLNRDQTQSAWNTLSLYGNMSSATFLFVLQDLLKQQQHREWSVGLGFGPGLSMEGILLRCLKRNHHEI